MIIQYFGHSALQIETGGKTLLVDPFITGNPHAEGVVEAGDLRPDVILLTHAHGDHFGDTPAIAARSGAQVVANFEITQHLATQFGHDNVLPMNTGGAVQVDWGWVKQTYARHSSSFPDGTYGGNPNGYLIGAEGKTVYIAGDTDPFSEMAWIGEDHDLDLAFLPIGDCFTMGPTDAVRAARMLRATVSVPVHYGTFAPIEVDAEAWVASMEAAGLGARIMGPGERMEL